MTKPHLILGNAAYSSWSMRPYLVMKRAGMDFTTEFVPLRTQAFRDYLPKVSPFGLVPTLKLGDDAICDSLAISEWAAEEVASLWPQDQLQRAKARMLTGQMHAGFMSIRRELPMNLNRSGVPRETLDDEVVEDITKMSKALGQQLHNSGGPFLFGDYSIADAFYTPIATRFESYGIGLEPIVQAYMANLLEQPEYLAWKAIADAEEWVRDDIENDYN